MTVKAKLSNDGPPDWGTVSDCYASSNFTTDGGQIGFSGGFYHISVDNLTVETRNSGSWTNAIVEHDERFTINGSSQAEDMPVHDAAGRVDRGHDILFFGPARTAVAR